MQGVAVARCYGLFEADVPVTDSEDSPSEWEVRLPPSGWTDLSEEESPDKYVDEDPHPRLVELRERRDKLSVLVLERLGGELPVGVPIEAEVR